MTLLSPTITAAVEGSGLSKIMASLVETAY
jgi:hypothetical protein